MRHTKFLNTHPGVSHIPRIKNPITFAKGKHSGSDSFISIRKQRIAIPAAHTRRSGKALPAVPRPCLIKPQRHSVEREPFSAPHCFRLKKQTLLKEPSGRGLNLLSPVYRTYSTEITGIITATSRFIAHQAWVVYHTFSMFAIGFSLFICKYYVNKDELYNLHTICGMHLCYLHKKTCFDI